MSGLTPTNTHPRWFPIIEETQGRFHWENDFWARSLRSKSPIFLPEELVSSFTEGLAQDCCAWGSGDPRQLSFQPARWMTHCKRSVGDSCHRQITQTTPRMCRSPPGGESKLLIPKHLSLQAGNSSLRLSPWGCFIGCGWKTVVKGGIYYREQERLFLYFIRAIAAFLPLRDSECIVTGED